ncbi:nucleotide exchange factor GrpE [Streptomyces sp. NPDC015125]|uniref:nucleotide exchange factor GrpE n=1 Tax=Streptomyces sp. NPDC015125 TaxID=3364938 RepID=UPI0036FD79A5
MNRPTHIRDLPQPPLALVGHGQEETSGPVPPGATQAEERTAQDGAGRPSGDGRDPGPPDHGPDHTPAPGSGSGSGSGSGKPGRSSGRDRDTDRPSRQDGTGARPTAQEAVLRAELQERTADLQRLKAEYDNYRKRVHRDRLAVGEIAVANVLSRLLPVLDALAEAGEQGEVTGGFQRIAEALHTELGALGLQPFGTAGAPFDPLIHEAVTYTPDDQLEDTTCTAVLRQGYRVGDRLLRPAQVTVAGKPPAGA